MTVDDAPELADYCRDVAQRAARASRALAQLLGDRKNRWLVEAARELRQRADLILAANQQDLAAAPAQGLTAAQIERLTLTDARVADMAAGLERVAALPDPIGETIESTVRPNGLQISKVRVPLGTVLFIYESRPNVTADAAAICVKSGNAVILRGGKEARHSSGAIVKVLQDAAVCAGLPEDAVQLVATTDRAAVGHLLQLDQYIDVAIPRGGASLIRRVTEEARMPVIKHFDGNCHVYVDDGADLAMALDITLNAKCQRMGVCNACESLLVHTHLAGSFLPQVGEALRSRGVEIRGDRQSRQWLREAVAATEADYFAEYLGPQISVRVVDTLEQAIDHINHYGSHHTDAIVTQSLAAARQFVAAVDSAAVMVNASTRFNDGGEFGLGAEIGISTDKFHARGPCGLKELTSYKYVVYGNGHVRT